MIRSVLFEIQTYWALVFLLPKKILSMITSVYRIFLWTGSNKYSRRALVAWDILCQPKSTGALNLLNFFMWNKAAICKLLWCVAKKKEALWVQRIHHFYIKGRDLANISSPKQASWLVRRIFDARRWLNDNEDIAKFLDRVTILGKFSSKRICNSLLP